MSQDAFTETRLFEARMAFDGNALRPTETARP